MKTSLIKPFSNRKNATGLALAVCLCLATSPGAAQTGNEDQELDDAAEGLSQLLEGLQGLKKKLPDRSLRGSIRVSWDIGYSHERSHRTGHCTAFGTFSLKPSSMEAYPIGQWSSRNGTIDASTAMNSERTPQYGAKRTSRWQGSARVGASVNISTFEESQSYSIRFSSANIPVAEVHQTEGHPPRKFKGRQCDMAISVEEQPLPQANQPFAGSFRDPELKLSISWDFRPNTCDTGEVPRPPEVLDPPTGKAKTLQAAVVAALGNAAGAGPEHVGASWNDEDILPMYVLRLDANGCLLPGVRYALDECGSSGKQEGASHLAVGTIQQAAATTRANIRIFEVETGVIRKTGRADAQGTDPDAIEAAVAGAIAEMGQRFDCARPGRAR